MTTIRSHWFQAARLQMYTIVLSPIVLGNVAAWYEQRHLSWVLFLLSALIALAVHLTTAFVNDIADFASDESNNARSLFSGGSGVIAQGHLSPSDLAKGAGWAVTGSILLALVMVIFLGGHWGIFFFLGWGLIASIGYSLPPLKVSYRGGGEFLVLLTYSIGLVGAGFFVQYGSIRSPLPWLLSIPLGFAVFSAIAVTQFPDRDADLKAKKRSLVILLGERTTLGIIATAIILSLLSIVISLATGGVPIWAGILTVSCFPIAYRLLKKILYHEMGMPMYTQLIQGALTLTLWFGLAPALGLFLDSWLG